MDQIDANRNRLDKQGKNDSEGKGFPKGSRRIFYGEFWQNNPWAFWAGIVGGVLVTPILNIPHLTKYDLRFIASGLSIWLLTCVVWYFDGKSKLGTPTEEEIGEQFRRDTNKSLNSFGSALQALQQTVSQQGAKLALLEPRNLTPDQRDEISRSMSAFRGQKIIVFSKWGDTEGLNYASGFIAALSGAQWDFYKGPFARPQMYESGFRNVRVYISLDDYGSKTLPPAALALIQKLFDMKLIDNDLVGTDNELAKGEISLRISGQSDVFSPSPSNQLK
jgi:hypothetical protein